jgi:hypothetical protein
MWVISRELVEFVVVNTFSLYNFLKVNTVCSLCTVKGICSLFFQIATGHSIFLDFLLV